MAANRALSYRDGEGAVFGGENDLTQRDADVGDEDVSGGLGGVDDEASLLAG